MRLLLPVALLSCCLLVACTKQPNQESDKSDKSEKSQKSQSASSSNSDRDDKMKRLAGLTRTALEILENPNDEAATEKLEVVQREMEVIVKQLLPPDVAKRS